MAKRRPSGDGMVRKREDGRWEGRIVIGHKENGAPIFHYLSARTQKELLEKLHRCIDEYDGAELTEDCRMTLGEWLEIWLTECAEPSVRPSTFRGYRAYVRDKIAPYLGEKEIRKVTVDDIQNLYRKLKKEGGAEGGPLSGASVRRIHGVLHQALKVAADRHLIVKNPTDNVTLPKREPSPRTILNDEQLERFMEAIRQDRRWHDFFYLEITTGLRRGELCGLMWSDFDEKKGTLSIRRTLHGKEGGGYYVGDTKTGTGRRIIKLPPSTVQLLTERKRAAISQWIFPNPIHPEDPVMPNSGYNRMKKLLAEQETWDRSLRALAAQKLTTQANEWLADNDQIDRDPEKDPITEDEFARRILLTEFTVSPGGRFTAWYEDDDMFWGHVITVDGTLKKGPVDADIQG